jgi:hypothetical protein
MFEVLVSKMVELEDKWISLAAIDAWSLAEELHEERGALDGDRTLAAWSVCYVALSVCRVVFLLVVSSAGTAVVGPTARALCVAMRTPM